MRADASGRAGLEGMGGGEAFIGCRVVVLPSSASGDSVARWEPLKESNDTSSQAPQGADAVTLRSRSCLKRYRHGVSNPYGRPASDDEDLRLVQLVKGGDLEALETLVTTIRTGSTTRLRMVYLPRMQRTQQEILIKLLTRLSTFEGRSASDLACTASSSITCST